MRLNYLNIYTYTQLTQMGIKFARLKANRNIDPKVIKAKKKSMIKIGHAVAAVIVPATKAIGEGLEIVDFISGAPISESDAENYFVLVDGNIRFMTYLQLLEEGYTGEFYVTLPLGEDIAIRDLLIEINICTNPWKGPEYANGAYLMAKEKCPVLEYVSSLTSKGYSLPSASQWATLDNKFTAKDMAMIMKGTIDDKFHDERNLSKGRAIQEAASRRLGDEFLMPRTVVEWVKSVRSHSTDVALNIVDKRLIKFFNNLSFDEVNSLININGKSGGETKESLINKKLTEYYTAFCDAESNTVTV